ncbi:hypothetical protein [Klebsiella aerogenes]|uniref:hypothetical protein n=1 Tax=Klebsiella aerogenes TaxID=548 RepID=UPI003513824C|nr:hypothetical protein [Klebsiella aerogenes]
MWVVYGLAVFGAANIVIAMARGVVEARNGQRMRKRIESINRQYEAVPESHGIAWGWVCEMRDKRERLAGVEELFNQYSSVHLPSLSDDASDDLYLMERMLGEVAWSFWNEVQHVIGREDIERAIRDKDFDGWYLPLAEIKRGCADSAWEKITAGTRFEGFNKLRYTHL